MTTRYSDSELEQMMTDLESELVERKRSLQGDGPTEIREAVCAFANDLPDHGRPGVIFVGADEAGRPYGTRVTDRLLRQLADIKTDGNIVPPPTLSVARHILKESSVAVVLVQPSDTPPVRYRGRTWIRIGSRRAVATIQDERILNEKRRYRDLSIYTLAATFPIPILLALSINNANSRAFRKAVQMIIYAPYFISTATSASTGTTSWPSSTRSACRSTWRS